jgi:hypothetical protein
MSFAHDTVMTLKIRQVLRDYNYAQPYGWTEQEDIVSEIRSVLKNERDEKERKLRELHDALEVTIIKLSSLESDLISNLELNGASTECLDYVHEKLPDALITLIRLEDRLNELRASSW